MKTTPRTVRELLSKPTSWTKNAYARDQHGKPVRPNDPSATSWCLEGAISRVYGKDFTARKYASESVILYYTETETWNPWVKADVIATWNDSPKRSYKDIVELLKNTGI